MLRFGVVAKKYTEVVGIRNKEFLDNIDLLNQAVISGCFSLKRSIPTHLRNIDMSYVYNNLNKSGFLPKSTLQINVLFDYYFDLALNDPEIDYNIINKLYSLKIDKNFKGFFIEVMTCIMKLQNNLFNKTYKNRKGELIYYMIKSETGFLIPNIDEDFIKNRKLNLKYISNSKESKTSLQFQTLHMNLILFYVHLNYYVGITNLKDIKNLEKILFGKIQGEFDENNLFLLSEMEYIEGLNDGIIRLTNKGSKKAKDFITKYWDIIETASQRHKLGDSELEILLCKYIVENMPPKTRINNAYKIIKFITKFNEKICWKYNFKDNDVRVPYHLLEKIDGIDLKCTITNSTFNNQLIIDQNYSDYYKKRKSDKIVFNGIVYRALNWNRTENEVEFLVSADTGYVDFQATCGKMRNEIDYKISEYNDNVNNLSKRLKYREVVMHKDRETVANYFKKRVTKMGILMCTIIVQKDKKGNFVNPRVPFIYRNEFVAEYPSFSGLVPSGAHQPSFLVEDENIKNKIYEIKKRANWKVSALRELGEELFDMELLSDMTINNLFESEEYKLCEEIANKSIYFGATGIGIDMYLGLCSILSTIIIDSNDLIAFINSELNKNNYSKNILEKVKNQISKINDDKINFDEGNIIFHDLNDNLMEKVLSPFYKDKEVEKNEIPVMVPCGVLSLVFGKQKYEELIKKI